MASIARDVRLDLGDPVWRVVPGSQLGEPRGEVSSVPEVPVAKHRDALANEDDVWPPRERRNIHAVPETVLPKGTA